MVMYAISGYTYNFSKPTKVNDTESLVQYGYINVKADKVAEVLKRSGHNGATIWYNSHDVSTTLVDLPRKTTHKEALEIIKKVGESSLGLINRNSGRWCIRVLKDEVLVKEIEAKIDPDFAAVVGPLLMKTPNAMGCRYLLKGLPNQLTYTDVAKLLKEEVKWAVRPEKFIKSKSNCNNMIVFAPLPPTQRLIHCNGTLNFIEIEDFVERKLQTTVIDKIFEDYNNKIECQYSGDVTYNKAQVSQDNKRMFMARWISMTSGLTRSLPRQLTLLLI